MRLLLVGSAAIVAAVAVGVAGLTSEETDADAVAWSFACGMRAEAPCGPGAEVGKE
jgi:hypothetical protein